MQAVIIKVIANTKVASTREEQLLLSDIKFAVSTKKKIVRLIRKIKTSDPFPIIRLVIQASNKIAKNWHTRA